MRLCMSTCIYTRLHINFLSWLMCCFFMFNTIYLNATIIHYWYFNQYAQTVSTVYPITKAIDECVTFIIWPVYRRCLCPRVGVGSCGTAVAPRSTILPTWATPGPSFLLTSCGESYRTISIMRSSIAWTSQILTTRCVDTDIDDLQGISGRETENAQQILLNVF